MVDNMSCAPSRLTIFPRACVGPQHMLKQCLFIKQCIEQSKYVKTTTTK